MIIVIILSILVFLSATRSPLQEGGETSPLDQGILDPETLFVEKEEEIDTITPAKDQQTSQQGENNVLATITFSDNQTPEKQLRQPQYPANTQDDAMSYTVRMRASWSERLHPYWYPQGAHLSPMVAWSHRLKNILFRENGISSEGMEIMAETGATKTLVQEIQNNILAGTILTHNVGLVFNAPGENEIQIPMTKDAPYITVVSMIAPSPDWFITAQNIQLYEDGRWLERVNIPAVLYDAGTDGGTSFTAADIDTNPKKPITKIRNAPSVPIASFEFVKN